MFILDWWRKWMMARIAERQRRWAMKRIQQYAEKLYDAKDPQAHNIGYELMRLCIELPPTDFK